MGESCASGISCQTGAALCDDGMSCAAIGACKNTTNTIRPVCPPTRPLYCADGETCVADVATECPTGGTCGAGEVKCADLSCAKDVTQCPSSEGCVVKPFLYRCSDGSCVETAGACPTRKTCPAGAVLCQSDGSCRYSSTECPSATARACALSEVRCPDGSCQANKKLCPMILSCPPTYPIKCWDGSCKGSLVSCPPLQTCPEGTVTCSVGSCVDDAKLCPTSVQCPPASPVLCQSGICAQNATLCAPPSDPRFGPTWATVRCPGNSFVSSLAGCGQLL